MSYDIDQLSEEDRQRELRDLLAMQQDNNEPGVQYATGQRPLSDLTNGRSEGEINQLLSGMQIRSPGFDPEFMTRKEPQQQQQQMPQNYIRNESTGKVTDLGQSVKQHDVYRDGPQVLRKEQNPDGTINQWVKKATTDGFGRQSTVVVQETVIPDYLNPAKLKELEFQKRQAEVRKTREGTGKPVAVIGPDGKPTYVSQESSIGMTPYSPSIAGGAQFSPEALRLTAEQFLAGDKSAAQGFARNATARVALQNEIAKVAQERGMDGKRVAAQMSEFQGMMAGSRAVGTRTANIEMAADEAKQLMPIALEASMKVTRSGLLPFGKAGIMFDEQTNDPNLRAFAVANNGLINTYARAITPTGVVTQADKEHARDLLSTAFDQKSYEAAVRQMEVEMDAALAAPGHVRAAMTSAITGKPKESAQPAVGGARAQGEALFAKSKDRIAAEKWLQDNPFHPKYDKVKATLGSM